MNWMYISSIGFVSILFTPIIIFISALLPYNQQPVLVLSYLFVTSSIWVTGIVKGEKIKNVA